MPISSSVGKRGANSRLDVALVQQLLNLRRREVPLLPRLNVDGVVGPRTIAAIELFQQQCRFRVVDGRVDPEGPTIASLEAGAVELAQKQVRADLISILASFDNILRSRHATLPVQFRDQLAAIQQAVLNLPYGAGPAISPMNLPDFGVRSFQLAAAPALGVAAGVELLMIMFLALIAMLIIIQNAPAMGRAADDLIRRMQALASKVLDTIRDMRDKIREIVRAESDTAKRCEGELAHFFQLTDQIINLLTTPRDPDPIKQQQRVIRISNLVKQWDAALQAVIKCFARGGGGGGIPKAA